MSNDDPYTNLDLDTADELLVAAGHPAIARALRLQTNANRNMIQGEWGQKVVDAFENILQVRVVAVLASVQISLDQQIELVQQVLTAHREDAARLKKHGKEIVALQSVAANHTARLNQLDMIEEWRSGVDDRLSKIEQADRDDIRTEIKNTNAEIASMKAMLAQYDSELRELVDRLAKRGGDAQ